MPKNVLCNYQKWVNIFFVDDPIPSNILSPVSEEYFGQKPSLFITRCACLFSVIFFTSILIKVSQRKKVLPQFSIFLCPPQSKIVDIWHFEECRCSQNCYCTLYVALQIWLAHSILSGGWVREMKEKRSCLFVFL